MKPLIIGNWKLNKNLAQVKEWADTVKKELADLDFLSELEAVICPPFPYLFFLQEILSKTAIKVGAQNVSAYDQGTYTGEVSAEMLAGVADYVLVGHSERRKFFGEDNETSNKKAIQALRYNITPVICVSDNADQGGAIDIKGKSVFNEENFLRQVTDVFKELSGEEKKKIVFCYEPPSAIAKQEKGRILGQAAGVDDVEKMLKLLKTVVPGNRMMYGGSVKSSNIVSFLEDKLIDGVLPGSASLDAVEFVKMIKKTMEI